MLTYIKQLCKWFVRMTTTTIINLHTILLEGKKLLLKLKCNFDIKVAFQVTKGFFTIQFLLQQSHLFKSDTDQSDVFNIFKMG